MRAITRATNLAVVIATAAAISSCSTSTPDGGEDSEQLALVGRTFVGDDVTISDKPHPLVPGSTLRVTFDQDRVGASAGCNTMSGSATWSTGTLIVDSPTLAMTEMGCERPLMEQDTWLADFLTSEPQVTQAGASITMTGGRTVMVLTDEEVVVPDAELTGTSWRLDSITTGGSVSSVPGGVESTLQLDDTGGIVVFLGCNTGRGAYRVTDNVLTIEPLATTLKACPAPAADVESAVAGFLRGDVTYSVDGDSLILTTQKNDGPGLGPTSLVYRS